MRVRAVPISAAIFPRCPSGQIMRADRIPAFERATNARINRGSPPYTVSYFAPLGPIFRAKTTAFVMPATAICEALRYVTPLFLRRRVDKIATANDSLWADLPYSVLSSLET